MEEYQNDIFYGRKLPLPNATAVFVLGICSIVFACCYVGLVIGIIALVLSREGRELYRKHPNLYTGFGLLNAGWIMSIIGTSAGGLFVLVKIAIFLIGSAYFHY